MTKSDLKHILEWAAIKAQLATHTPTASLNYDQIKKVDAEILRQVMSLLDQVDFYCEQEEAA